eukprot:TRINITY_DN28120_c0_g1_i1.p1 TRINITY_DN28120_c0_g1~~TRINITY_DN28120_c0_g1_i1.p1  ORF type:complete len:313 (+),score=64.09 TRINITY_DN28120_c0_g1_i1:108-1046(+)
MRRRPPRSTLSSSSAASDVYKRQVSTQSTWELEKIHKNKHPQLLYESKIYRILESMGYGIPQFYWYGVEGDFHILILDLLGPNLDDLLQFCGGKFNLKTVLMIADQMLNSIEYIHSKNFIHRDIKPENFLVGLGKKSDQIFVIDFGLAKKFRDPRTSLHIPYTENLSLTGTARYASINTHLGIEQSRRDDLESLGYVLMYFLRGDLPWMGLEAENKQEKYKLIREKKISTPVDVLCSGFPEEFTTILKYFRSLQFEERPDYVWVKRVFQDLFVKLQNQWDLIWDWAYISSNERKEKEKEKKLEALEENKLFQ